MRAHAVFFVVLAGCAYSHEAPPAARFSHPAVTQQTFMQDRYQCIRETQQNHAGGVAAISDPVNQKLFLSCMAAKGYVADPKGPLVPPPETISEAIGRVGD
jgi:hypothetical protein